MMEVDEHSQMILELSQGYEPGSFDWVHVTHINNPDSFYVRPTKYNQIIIDLEKTVPAKRPHDFHMHQCVVFRARSHRFAPARYIRGQVVGIDDTDEDHVYCNIFAVDYGYIHTSIPANRIWKCRTSVLEFPPLAFQCKLTNCSPMNGEDWSDESIETMVDYFSEKRSKMSVIDRTATKLIVEMTNSCPEDISTLLNMTGFSQPPPQPEIVVYRAPPPPPKIRDIRQG